MNQRKGTKSAADFAMAEPSSVGKTKLGVLGAVEGPMHTTVTKQGRSIEDAEHSLTSLYLLNNYIEFSQPQSHFSLRSLVRVVHYEQTLKN